MLLGVLLTFLMLISACAPPLSTSYLTASCPNVVETRGYYCDGDRAYTNLVPSGSRVRIRSLDTGKSITIATYRRDGTEGVCVPSRFKNLLGEEPFRARLELERCGFDGKTICPEVIRGLASWYGDPYHGRDTPYGVRYDMEGMYAASRDLPLGSLLRVKNLKNGREVTVKVIDRGPQRPGRVLDLSYGAAKRLDMLRDGVVEVEAKVIRCGE
ncbi:rare lipoprotein A [Thermocrinis albus DSM 14484]|uniref:Probable endolytic peptidoglycan transglycosylase RlpA n=1 Tax=Thermocrinis albus (strain DSM 14484 / JCM 11386 / HI 11/12) TaxID=638303 RepID=D3SL39_THEAH|nr:septal ring lytic transglycosylase RlpA family protein [Thermocrinis albus]ADC89469.1 rare lipoprotein A [Thermocrinis albus DSM 14484]